MRVAILDWGIGGMPVALGLQAASPGTELLYLSDSGFTPYGKLAREPLAERASWLLRQTDADLGILACNAASSVLSEIQCDYPIVGIIEHGLRVAMESTGDPVGVLAGDRVTEDGAYSRPLAAAGRRVLTSSGQPLSALVERGEVSGDTVEAAVARCVAPLRGASSCLLACTHYPALSALLTAALPGVALLDPTPALVDAVVKQYVPNHDRGSGGLRAITTGSPQAMARALWINHARRLEISRLA